MIKSGTMINATLSRHERLISIWSNIRVLLEDPEKEFLAFCEEEWRNLEQYQDGHINSHSLSTICAVMALDYYRNLDFHDQNVIVFSLLFHDISKKGRPAIKGKDPLHPYTCAATTLLIFNRLGWVKNNENIERVAEKMSNSFVLWEGRKFMDKGKLKEIYDELLWVTGIYKIPGQGFGSYSELTENFNRKDLFVFEIIALILLHQSVDLDPKYPNFTPLDLKEIGFFLSPRLLKLLTIVHIGDNGSYNVPCRFEEWNFHQRIWKNYRKIKKKLW